MAEIINMNIPPPPAGPLGPPPMMAGPGGLQPGPNRLPPHPNMQIMGGPPMHMPPFNMPQNFPRVFQPTYEGFTLVG
ncbi:hypothetical protein EJ08DRAFT_648230 [Tothia fuscella]|uniref:Uncharacterized protein n=1 Tax=Tothia fuscella TaxID=1048955 RepID=A0A9P4NW91_9PEZI|nr:hypothetical protein EJ08DRAFT_648230 [Tothia fuscella]